VIGIGWPWEGGRQLPVGSSESQSMAAMSDRGLAGHEAAVSAALDSSSRESPALKAGLSLYGEDVAEVLDRPDAGNACPSPGFQAIEEDAPEGMGWVSTKPPPGRPKWPMRLGAPQGGTSPRRWHSFRRTMRQR
jgi:hypothetical protein